MKRPNLIKVSVGFLLGFVLLYFVQDFNYILINIIQFLFFWSLYSILDKIMKNEIKHNFLKVSTGFLFGFVLLFFIPEFHFIIINIIQFLFFWCLYSILDKILEKDVKYYFFFISWKILYYGRLFWVYWLYSERITSDLEKINIRDVMGE